MVGVNYGTIIDCRATGIATHDYKEIPVWLNGDRRISQTIGYNGGIYINECGESISDIHTRGIIPDYAFMRVIEWR